MIDTIFFDVDGTLYDETHAKITAELQVAEHVAVQTDMDFNIIYNVYHTAKWEVINGDGKNPNRNNRTKWYEVMLENLHIQKIEAKILSGKYWGIVKKNINPYYDVALVLPILSKQYNLCVITDELLEICEEKLEILSLRNYFYEVISSTHVGSVKPHRELFEYALKRVNTTADKAIMVGDNPARDILGGNRAGLKTAWIKRGRYFYYPLGETEVPDIVISNFVNFPRQIEEVM